MIQANDLRVGNFVDYGSSTRRITQIGDSPQRKYVGVDNMITELLSVIQPILLTPEILLACGFGKNGEFNGNECFSIEKSNIEGSTDYCLYFNDDSTGQYYRYLHQLQNLYFALTGEELEYKPKR